MTEAPSGYDRITDEKYFTPAWVTDALLDAEPFVNVWEPAAGAGHMFEAIRARTFAFASDIAPDQDWIVAQDFLVTDPMFPIISVITNPPYGKGGRLAEAFIRRALDVTRPAAGKVAMLLRVDFDSARTRRPLFGDHPAFAAKYVLTRRIRWANIQQQEASPTQNHAWFVWDWSHLSGPPSIKYLPIETAEVAAE